MLVFLTVIMALVLPSTMAEYYDQYGNPLRRHRNPTGNQRLHPENHVHNYGFGRHLDRYRNRFVENGGSRRTQPRTVVTHVVAMTHVMY